MSQPPERILIYHIVHRDRLPSILADGFLWSDAEVRMRESPGTTVGMSTIKDRRLGISLTSRPGLHVGHCVPFYFCPRSVMLYLLHKGNREGVTYRGGQAPILHLVADLQTVVDWADENGARWAFTLSNAASNYFEDRCDLTQLDEIDWAAVNSNRWSGNGVSRNIKEAKQAEFLLERMFPWELFLGIGTFSKAVGDEVTRLISGNPHRPAVQVRPDWYY